MSIVASSGAPGVVALRGDLDLASADELRLVLADCAVREVDMAGVDFLGAAGLRVLVEALQRREEHGGQLRIVNAGRAVRRTLDVAGLLDAFVRPAETA